MLKILFLGDIVARPGREAVVQALPKLKAEYKPDLVIANAENIAHGKGVTQNTLNELLSGGIDFFTSGNHVWKKEGSLLLENRQIPLIRPANYPEGVPGRGFEILPVLSKKIAIINLIGRTFFKNHYDCPFKAADRILAELEKENLNAIIVDFHAEATSEAKALGYYLDGRVSAVLGTHTHIPTADEEILENKTAFITDVGMCGVKDSILGKNKEEILETFLKQDAVTADWDETWSECVIQGVYLEIDNNKEAKKIARVSKTVKKE